jgi:hypothetical protein
VRSTDAFSPDAAFDVVAACQRVVRRGIVDLSETPA